MADYLKSEIEDVKKKGFGIIPKLVMTDERLSIEAKAIYSYMASYAGAGDTAFPGITKMIKDLNISEKRFYSHRKKLVELGYLTITKTREGNRRGNNIYTLNQIVKSEHSQNDSIEESEHSRFESVQNESVRNESVQNESVQNDGTNSNSINNNSINNNSIIKTTTTTKEKENCSSSSKNKDLETNKNLAVIAKEFEQSGFGTINLTVKELLEELLKNYSVEWIVQAFKIAVKKNKRRLDYVEGILENWLRDGGMKLSSEKKGADNNGGSSTNTEQCDPYEGIGITL